MTRRLVTVMCSAAMIGLWAAVPATAKTVKQCDEEWTANKAAIQASGKTKKAFVGECRAEAAGAPPAANTAAPATAATDKLKTVKQCDEEWTANKAAIQASGQTKKAYVAECRKQTAGAPPAVSTAAPAPAAQPAPAP